MTKLKPCPFCGSEAYHYAPGPIDHHVACRNHKGCGAEVTGDSEEEAIDAWNTRAETNVTADETNGTPADATLVMRSIDRLRQALEGYIDQLESFDKLQTHCDRQRERIATLEAIHKRDKGMVAELRQELAKWERLTASIELPEHPITEFQPKDLERENAKMRRLITALVYCMQDDADCDKCSMNNWKARAVMDKTVACNGLRREVDELKLGIEVSDEQEVVA